MASFTTSNVSTNTVGRELSIASSFVKQYYTLLNKAPCYIYNFYSHDSTFIHGTIEMANEHYTEPVVGREKIKKKMEDLKLNDCRAKIKQIDCLATLAGGLVIQVIGELSDNGRPMRRFLQTFVLAPSPDESRQEGDSHPARSADRRNFNVDENSSPSQNQIFFVLNSIFRYQDEGTESEFGDDITSVNANAPVDSSNGGSDLSKVDHAAKQTSVGIHPNGAVPDYSQARRLKASENVRATDDVERLTNDLEEGAKLNKPSGDTDFKRESGGQRVVSNGTGNVDKKNETSEKPTENGKTAPDHSQPANTPSGPGVDTTNQSSPAVVANRPIPSNEPKTWANMVRNNTQSSASVQLANVSKPAVAVSEHQQQHQNVTQSSSVQAHSQQQHHNHQQNQHQHQHHQQQQQHQHPQQPQQHQQQPQQQQSPQLQQQQQHLQQQQGSQNNNARRRHVMRKPSNKSTGRSIKNRPPRPMTGTPGTGGKPVA